MSGHWSTHTIIDNGDERVEIHTYNVKSEIVTHKLFVGSHHIDMDISLPEKELAKMCLDILSFLNNLKKEG